MNSSISFLFAMMFFAVTMVIAQDNVVLQVVLNNAENKCGAAWGPCCNAAELKYISDRFYTMVDGNQRQLRGSDVDEKKHGWWCHERGGRASCINICKHLCK